MKAIEAMLENKNAMIPPLSSTSLEETIIQSIDDSKGEDITSISLRGKADFADMMIIATGRSSRHVASIAEKLALDLKAQGIKDVSIEGLNQGDWVLVDAHSIIIHIFRAEIRSYYNLERMWQVDTAN